MKAKYHPDLNRKEYPIHRYCTATYGDRAYFGCGLVSRSLADLLGCSSSKARITFPNASSLKYIQVRSPNETTQPQPPRQARHLAKPLVLPIFSPFCNHTYPYLLPSVMSAAPASGAAPASKQVATDKSADSAKDNKPTAALEEDDEFEDFPVESRFIRSLGWQKGGECCRFWGRCIIAGVNGG